MMISSLQFKVAVTLFVIVFLFSGFMIAQALTKEDIVYPIAELGGCKNEQECRGYCDKPDNFAACFAFGKTYGLISGPIADKPVEQVQRLSRQLNAGEGPGGCKSHEECEAYCSSIDKINECVSFAEENDLMSGDELDEAKKIRDALAKGVKPPGNCQNKEQCEAYCFGEGGPDTGDFKSDRINECIDFGVSAGFMTAEEASIVKKTGGKGPGGCRGRECQTYCENPENNEACFAFAEENGLISREEAKFAKKVMQRTGCKGREDCEKYFENNQELAEEMFVELQSEDPSFNPAELIPEKERGKIKDEVRARISKELQNMPEGVASCIRPAIEELLNRPNFSPFSMRTEMQSIMERCFQESGGFPGAPGEFPGQGGHPGGTQQQELTAGKERCIQTNFSIAVLTQVQIAIENREQLDSALAQEIKEKCSFEVSSPTQQSGPSGFAPPSGGSPGFNFPPQVTACLESKGVLQQLTSLKGRPSLDIKQQINICFQESFKQQDSFEPHEEQQGDFPFPVEELDRIIEASDLRQENFSQPTQHPNAEEFQKEYGVQYQQQFEQQYQQEFQGQFEQQYQEQIHQESQVLEQHQSRRPTFGEFLVGTMFFFLAR